MNNLYIKILLAILLAIILFTQGFWIFTDAKKEAKNTIGFGVSLDY